jgi:hypothetical protein
MDHALKSAISQVYPYICVLILLHICPRTTISGSYMCDLILLCMCPHTVILLHQAPVYMFPHTTYYICVLILLYQAPIYMCPHTTIHPHTPIYVLISYCICVIIRQFVRYVAVCGQTDASYCYICVVIHEADIRQHTLTYAAVCPHTAVYVSIR